MSLSSRRPMRFGLFYDLVDGVQRLGGGASQNWVIFACECRPQWAARGPAFSWGTQGRRSEVRWSAKPNFVHEDQPRASPRAQA